MDFEQHIQFLRVQLLCMSRLSQRALDYAIKGYQLGSPEFCRQVRALEHKLGEHHCHIKYLCHQIATEGTKTPADFRFSLAALRVDSALQRTYSAAAQIAQETILILENCPVAKCPSLDRFGRLVNSLVRLCTVALFEREVGFAETVLQSQEIWRRCELIFDYSSSDVDQQMEEQHSYALAITQNLGVIAKQAHEMADAILFWLKGRESVLALETDAYDVLNFVSRNSTRRESEYQPATARRLLRGDFMVGK
jgi:phosphate uptake regulator